MESHNEKTFFALDKQRTPESGRGSGQVPRCSGSERVAPAGQRGVGQAAALVGGGGAEQMSTWGRRARTGLQSKDSGDEGKREASEQ